MICLILVNLIYVTVIFLPIVLGFTMTGSSVGIPAATFNKLKTLRIGVVGDIDSNEGFTTQLEIANHYNVQVLIIPGDFEYTNGQKVLSDLQSHGFTKENTDIVVGNHDSGKDVKMWLNNNRTFGQVKFDFSGNKLALFNIDANTKFDCYDPLFRTGGIDGVLQAHNHNYQRFNVHGMMYGVFGTGTHDTGSGMYPLNSDTWQGNNCLKCITGKNGITIIDLHFNENTPKHFVGWLLGMRNEVLDGFDSLNHLQ